MNKFILTTILVLFAGILKIKAQEKVLQAGASQIDITPFLKVEIVGNFDVPFANNIHDPLQAKTLVLDDGTTKIAMVLVDNVGVNQKTFDTAKEYIQTEIGLKKENILMASTHTHSGPSTGRRYIPEGQPLNEYAEFLARKIADGVRTANNNLEPAKIAWGGVDVPDHLFVRRWIMKDSVISPFGTKDIVRMNPGPGNPDLVKTYGPIDPEVSFISVQSVSGRPISVLANYSLHYVGWVPKGDVSADYFALFGTYLDSLVAVDRNFPKFVGIMSNGTSGNVNNTDYDNADDPRRSMDRPYEQMNYVAKDIAGEVYRALQKVTYRSWVPLGVEQSLLKLKVHKATPEILANVGHILSRSDTEKPLYSAREKIYARSILEQELLWPNEIDVPLQAFRIGELGITAVPFEVFTQTGLELKDKSPFEDHFTIELANGSFGYLPTPEEVELGGYETWLGIRYVEKYSTVKITDQLLKLLQNLKISQ